MSVAASSSDFTTCGWPKEAGGHPCRSGLLNASRVIPHGDLYLAGTRVSALAHRPSRLWLLPQGVAQRPPYRAWFQKLAISPRGYL